MNKESNSRERTIDLLVGSAFFGGVESVIQRTVPFLRERGFSVRIIQMIWRGVDWAPSEAEFHCICMDEKEIGYDLFLNGYKDYLQKEGSPDLMVAVYTPSSPVRRSQEAPLSLLTATSVMGLPAVGDSFSCPLVPVKYRVSNSASQARLLLGL